MVRARGDRLGHRRALNNLDLHFPEVDKADRSEFAKVREALLAEEKGGKGTKK